MVAAPPVTDTAPPPLLRAVVVIAAEATLFTRLTEMTPVSVTALYVVPV